MFKDWEEYTYHLIENIVQEEKNRIEIKKKILEKSKLIIEIVKTLIDSRNRNICWF